MIKRFEVCYRTRVGNFGSIYFDTLEESVKYYLDSIIKTEAKQALIYDNEKKIIVIKYEKSKYETIRRNT